MRKSRLTVEKLAVCVLVLAGALLLMGASSGCETQMPTPVSFPSKVVWTPDGKHIIFSRGFQGMFMVDAAGSELRAIPEDAPLGTPSSPGYALPAVSPDGTRLAYVARPSAPGKSAAIMVSALDGTGARRLTQDERFNTYPAWSPDGEEIAYIADGQLTVMRADGTNVSVLAPSVQAVNAALAWSPDSSRIAFVGEQPYSVHRAVFMVRPDGTELTNLAATVSVPSWSPDGSRIAFLMPEDYGSVSLFTLDNEGNDLQRAWSLGRTDVRRPWSLVITNRWFGNLSWSPDGSAVLYVSDVGNVEVVSLDYANEMLRFLFEDTAGTTPQKGLPGGTLARAPGRWAAWNPDSSRIAVLSSNYQDSLFNPTHGDEIYTMARDAALKRVLVHREGARLGAEHPNWYDTAHNIAACSEGFVVPDPEENAGLVQDCEILMAIRDELAGDFLLNWSSTVPMLEWLGVGYFPNFLLYRSDEIRELRVTILYLRGRGDVDRYSGRLMLFAGLHKKDDRGGGIAYEIDIGTIGLNGSIPKELSKLTKLWLVELSYNRLSGSIPPQLAELTDLMHLALDHNNLSGSIPPELSRFSHLMRLDLSGNSLTGNLPPELANPRLLNVLNLSHNRLSGEIPPELGSGRYDLLDLSHNELSGSIPPELANVVYVTPETWGTVRLHGNPLSGCMPRMWEGYVNVSDEIHEDLEFCAE